MIWNYPDVEDMTLPVWYLPDITFNILTKTTIDIPIVTITNVDKTDTTTNNVSIFFNFNLLLCVYNKYKKVKSKFYEKVLI